MRHYETTFIVDSSLDPEKIESIIDKSSEIITRLGGEIVEIKHWGKRRLAYEIAKRQYGYYVIFNYRAPGEVIKELERTFRLNQNILRYLTIYLDEKTLRLIAGEEERKRKKEEQENENAVS